jgi:hypothetical protein
MEIKITYDDVNHRWLYHDGLEWLSLPTSRDPNIIKAQKQFEKDPLASDDEIAACIGYGLDIVRVES